MVLYEMLLQPLRPKRPYHLISSSNDSVNSRGVDLVLNLESRSIFTNYKFLLTSELFPKYTPRAVHKLGWQEEANRYSKNANFDFRHQTVLWTLRFQVSKFKLSKVDGSRWNMKIENKYMCRYICTHVSRMVNISLFFYRNWLQNCQWCDSTLPEMHLTTSVVIIKKSHFLSMATIDYPLQ